MEATELVSPQYLEQLRLLHDTQPWGRSGYSHAPEVAKWRRKTGSKTVLDYGCGRATLKESLMKIDPTIKPHWIREYDPAIPGKDAPPKPADLLVATDVLEHIEPDKISKTLLYLRELAKKGAYFTVALTASKVSLPNGRNAHLIIKPAWWWMNELKIAKFTVIKAMPVKGLWIWAK